MSHALAVTEAIKNLSTLSDLCSRSMGYAEMGQFIYSL